MNFPFKFSKIINLSAKASTYLLFAFPLMSVRMTSKMVIVWSVLNFINYLLERPKLKVSDFLYYAPLPLYLVFYIISPFISESSEASFFQLEKRIFFLVFPLIFFLNNHWKIDSTKCLMVFAISNILICSFAIVNFTINDYWIYFDKVTNLNNPYRVHLSELFDTHPTYFGLFFSFSILILLNEIMNRNRICRKQKLYDLSYSFGIILMLFFIFLLAVRIAIVGLLITFPIFFLWRIESKRKAFIVIFILFITVCSTSLLIPSIKSRVLEVWNTKLEMPKDINYNSTSIRVAIYSCSFNLLKENWHTGYYGDLSVKLNECLKKIPTEAFQIMGYNAHNQYLHSWLSFGILGIIVLVGILIFSLYLSIFHNELLFFTFISLVSIFFITENILSIQRGIIFFSLFNSFFITKILKDK